MLCFKKLQEIQNFMILPMCQCGLVYSGSNLMSSKYSRMDPESCNIPNRVRRVDQSMTPIHMCPQKKYFRKIQIFSEIANSDMVESASHPHPHTYGGAPSNSLWVAQNSLTISILENYTIESVQISSIFRMIVKK